MVDVTFTDVGPIGLTLAESDDGTIVEEISDDFKAAFPDVVPGMLLLTVGDVDVSAASGRAMVYTQELVNDTARPLVLEFKTPIKKAQQTKVTVKSEGPLGLILHDSELGARVDHVSAGVIKREHPHVRVGLVLVKVNDDDVSPASGLIVNDIIPLLLDGGRPLILTFIRPGTEDLDEDHHDFVINPVARKKQETEAEEDGETGEAQPVESGLTSFVNCQAWAEIKTVATVQFGYELVMCGTVVWTNDWSQLISLIAAIGPGCMVLGLAFGQTKESVKLYIATNIIALVVGVAFSGVMLWYLLDYCDEPDKAGIKWNAETNTQDNDKSTNTVEWSAADKGNINVTQWADRECKATDDVQLFVAIFFVVDICIRSAGLLKAVMRYPDVVAWWESKNSAEHASAQKVQAMVRGNQDRKRIRAEKGIVTKALAGSKFKAEMYRPATPLERKVQLILKDMWNRQGHGNTELRSFHSIRGNASSVHRIFAALKKAFRDYDLDGNGTIELDEAQAALKDMGAVVSSLPILYPIPQSLRD